MPALTSANKSVYLSRFEKIAPDAKPLWGKMTGAQMIGHVTGTLLYTLGDTPVIPFRGNFKTQFIYAPLLLNGILKFPKNVKIPQSKKAKPIQFTDGTIDVLSATIDRVLAELDAGEFHPPHHPFFGHIGPQKWMKFHAANFDHHLRQFGR